MAAYYEENIDCCIRGFHFYQEIWNPVIGEHLSCEREPRNAVDRYAVATVRGDGAVVSHLPKKISTMISFFIRRGGQLTCTVTGKRCHTSDLIQGGLEIPCKLSLKCKEKKDLSKLLNMIDRLMLSY